MDAQHPAADTPDPQRRRLLGAFAGSAALAACGGGGGSSGDPGNPTDQPSPPVDGPAWPAFGRDAQRRAQAGIATADLNRIAWRTPVDLVPPYRTGALLAHYGSPVISSRNTVVVPLKTLSDRAFRIEARAGGNGVLMWQLDSDYVLPPGYNWMPSWNLTLDAANRVHAPAAGGRLLVRDSADTTAGSVSYRAFYGASAYAAASATFDTTVYINTPITLDAAGTAYFGFVVTGANPAGLTSGIARVAADGTGSWVAASTAANDTAIAKVQTNCAPALSNDGLTVYLAVNVARVAGQVQRGYLLALDSRTLATRNRVALLDVATGTSARISDDSTASPAIGPDGDVYFGVLENSFGTHNGRGWLLHFDSTLATSKIPGSFGWDDTPSVMPASMVPGYTGTSTYLLLSKYNNYEGVGTGDGKNRMAVLDPFDSQVDLYSSILPPRVMREVATLLGPTPEAAGSAAVKEWCVNTVALDPQRKSVLVNSEDGYLYRWDLVSNTFTQRIQLTSGIAESYTPTAVGADGTIYAINNAVMFAVTR